MLLFDLRYIFATSYADEAQIDLRGAPLKPKMKFFQRNTKGLMEYLRERDARKHIKVPKRWQDATNTPVARFMVRLTTRFDG